MSSLLRLQESKVLANNRGCFRRNDGGVSRDDNILAFSEVITIKVARAVFIAAMVCEFIFIAICVLLLNLPSPLVWHGQAAYEFVTGHLFLIFFSQLIAIILAWYINTSLLIRWKLLLKGRHFWLRSIGSSGISEVIFSSIAVTTNMLGRLNLIGHDYTHLIHIVVLSIILKIVFSIVFAYPATLMVSFLRRIEGIDVFGNMLVNPLKP